jgi:polysaccharide export outer membrane protein
VRAWDGARVPRAAPASAALGLTGFGARRYEPSLNAAAGGGHHRSRMQLRVVVLALSLLFASVVLTACGRHYPPPASLPDPEPSAFVGPGDVLEVAVIGEKELPKEYEIQPDGTLDFPYLKPLQINGLEPHEIALKLRSELMAAKFLRDPQVQVKVKQFNSKRVYVLGQVSKPGPLSFTDGMTLVQAISASGWFTPTADTNHIQIIRIVSPTKSVNAIVSVDAITDNARPDLKLQQGDTIKVDQRLF